MQFDLSVECLKTALGEIYEFDEMEEEEEEEEGEEGGEGEGGKKVTTHIVVHQEINISITQVCGWFFGGLIVGVGVGVI